MFKGRRNRAHTGPQPLGARTPPVNTSAAASSAAVQAFLASRNSNANLSSAAAAAALRSHTTSPTNVSEVQTKRMQRRLSIGSNASAPGALVRQGSSGSMTERSFRDPSPGRAGSRANDERLPPMPAMPKAFSPTPKKRVPPRSALERTGVQSPTPSDAGSMSQPSSAPRTKKAANSARQQLPPRAATASPTAASRGSVNFSRPMSPTNSPPSSPILMKAPRLPTTATPAASSATTERTGSAAVDTADKPVKKKKKVPPQTSGDSDRDTAPPRPRAAGAAVSALEAATVASANSVTEPEKPVRKKKKKQPVVDANDDRLATDNAVPAPTTEELRINRASGILAKQPSIVREDREGEERAEKGLLPAATDQSDVPVTPKPQTAKPKPKQNKANSSSKLDPPDAGTNSNRNSVSPGRAARFSTVSLEPPSGGLHQPPPRSASPGKSALKHSPSPRNASPNDARSQSWNRPGFTPSEASDTPSTMSEESRRRKKAFRVSFDVEPTVVGEAAEPPLATGSPVVASPQNEKHGKRSWFSFGHKGKPQVASDDPDDVIKPVPALPSFGSVRGKRDVTPGDAEDEDVPILAVPTAPIREDPSSSEPTADSPKKAAMAEEPLSQEAANMTKDEDLKDGHEEDSKVQANGSASKTPLAEVKPNIPAEVPEVPNSSSVTEQTGSDTVMVPPTIQLQPATPNIDTETEKRDSYVHVPGGWSPESPKKKEFASMDSEAKQVSQTNEVQEGLVTTASDDKTALTSTAATAPNTGVLTTQPADSETKNQVTPSQVDDGDESDGSGSSVYNDASSETTETEGEGFASINQIVESPIPTRKANTNAAAITAPTKSLDTPQAKSTKVATEGNGLGPSTSAHTPLKSALKKPVEDSPAVPVVANKPKKKIAAKGAVATANPASAAATASALSTNTQKPSAMRKSMREASPVSSASPSRMRASMRAPDTRDGPMRMVTTMRSRAASDPKTRTAPPLAAVPLPPAGEGRATLQKKIRPMSSYMGAPASPKSAASTKRPLSIAGDGRIPANDTVPPVPIPSQKFPGYDSDSDSSFKRARPGRSASETRVSMRRSMRTMPPQQSAASRPQSQVFGNRPMSPSTRPASMKMTMRTQAEPERPKTPTRFFSRNKGKVAATPPSVPKARSRIVDSDDEGDAPSLDVRRSRYADSSDEEEPLPLDLAPVRGIPKKPTDGDSTDLEGEVETQGSATKSNGTTKPRPPPVQIPANTISTTHGSGGAALASKTLRTSETAQEKAPETSKSSFRPSFSSKRPEGERRLSFFGSLARRKERNAKAGKSDAESVARRDMPVERSQVARASAGKGHQVTPSTSTIDPGDMSATPTPIVMRSPRVARSPEPPQSPPRSPKLQRRTISRTVSDAWPLPPPDPTSSERPPPLPRPSTSEGMGSGGGRMSLGTRAFRSRPSSPLTPWSPVYPSHERKTVIEANGQPTVGRNGKKKRFQGLRKAFGLKD